MLCATTSCDVYVMGIVCILLSVRVCNILCVYVCVGGSWSVPDSNFTRIFVDQYGDVSNDATSIQKEVCVCVRVGGGWMWVCV